ncbi:Uncharacterised protein [Bordetella pertussis]|nr:Uncharacterised protein [Bordetella pertussis]
MTAKTVSVPLPGTGTHAPSGDRHPSSFSVSPRA